MPDNSTIDTLRSDPARFKVAKSASSRLAAMTGIDARKLAGKTIGELAKAFPHQIDPHLFLMRKICGSVVKTDPITGVDYPVPFATVQVEDTDCSFLGFFPAYSPWSWYFPFRCHREIIATVKTDACGNFCVWIPRFDIDWVLRWRRERKCFPIIFDRPNLHEIIDHLIPQVIPDFPPRPVPGPDPAPFAGIDRADLVARVRSAFGRDPSLRVARLISPAGFGSDTTARETLGQAPALLDHIAPPIPPELRLQLGEKARAGGINPAIESLAHRLAIDPRDLKAVDLRYHIGPFKRCFDVFFPEWTPVLDVPDITFRVLQDTNGDGIEEQIYGEGHFQVRWDAGALGNLVLHAGPNAIASPLCGPENIPCGNTPAIVMAGRLPLTGAPDTFDASSGYAVRTNRPHPSGLFGDPTPLTPAASPLRGVLSLFGCAKTDPTATHYRMTYEYSSNGGATFGTRSPFLGYTWPLFRLNGVGIGEWYFATPDVAGWYALALPAGANPWMPQDLLLDWPSYGMADGVYRMRLELGQAAPNTVSSQSADVSVVVDNSAPVGLFEVGVASAAGGPFTPIDNVCPVVRRGAAAQDRYFQVTLAASARHLRSVQLWASGCGSGEFSFVSGSGGNLSGPTTYRHWHDGVADNSQTLTVVYKLPATASEGTYSFGGEVVGRAFNPYDGGHLAVPPWERNTDESHVYPSVAFSVFNANP